MKNATVDDEMLYLGGNLFVHIPLQTQCKTLKSHHGGGGALSVSRELTAPHQSGNIYRLPFNRAGKLQGWAKTKKHEEVGLKR